MTDSEYRQNKNHRKERTMPETSLEAVLKSLDIVPDADATAQNQNQSPTFDIETIPEENRPAVKAALEAASTQIAALKTESAKKDLVNQTLTQAMEAGRTNQQGNQGNQGNQDNSVMGIPEDDVYYPQFKGMKDEIDRLKNQTQADDVDAWNETISELAKKHDDLPLVANDMDRIAKEHPTMYGSKRGMELCYKLAKEVHTNRETLKEQGRLNKEREAGANANAAERGGTNAGDVHAGASKTIGEAFNKAETQLAKKT